MNVRLQGNSQLRYGVNGGALRNSRPGDDDSLQCLSQEEQECIQFFEDTIGSLEESLEEENRRPSQVKRTSEVDGPFSSSPNDRDIIDLVHPGPDLVQTRESMFTPTSPDFQSMFPTPESHFEIKPRRDPSDGLPSEYNPPLPSGSYGPTDGHSYHPPGCIPTPVLIAQQIADNRAGGTSNLLPPSLLRRVSLESEKPPGCSADLPARHGPPTSAKPTRFPANISVIHGNKEHQNQSLANVNIHERRAQMLANLSGTAHPLLQEDTQPAAEPRNTPTRSVSFRDPTPDKSRMEALSKLGLTRNRAMSGGTPLAVSPNGSSLDPLTNTGDKPPEAGLPPAAETGAKLPKVTTPPQSQIHVDRKPEIQRVDSLKSREDRNLQPNLSSPAVTQSANYPPPLETKASVFPPPPPEVTSLEFNSYGGKSIVVHPSVVARSERPASPTSPEPQILPPALSNASEFNTYGGKTKVMTPVAVAVARRDLPDILSSHMDKSQTSPAKPEPPPTELNHYRGKSRAINPAAGSHRPPDAPTKSFRAAAPAPAPRPPRHSYHGGVPPQKAPSRALSPDHKRRTNSMFRPQGITVQFSGRGASNESRRDALKKLGLLKDS
ncbi:proline and serine-rich protein 2 [Brachyistius frenatus]|uniref:proline and serine-rich protein 2 n=1 Tax=Brachyistius frenatus TaxID=100188 RepID=UPI0037E8D7DA